MNGTVSITGRDYAGKLNDVKTNFYEPHGICVIDEHDLTIHEGSKFSATISITVGAGATAYVLGLVNGKAVHLLRRAIFARSASINGSIDLDIELWEEIIADQDVGNTDVFNDNRNLPDIEGTFKIHDNPTGVNVDDALNIKSKNSKLVSDKFVVAKSAALNDEYVMRSTTKYLLMITNNETTAVDIEFNWSWYETLVPDLAC